MLFNDLDPNVRYVFSVLSKETDYLDVHKKVVDYEVELDVYRKPTDSLSDLHYCSCQPKHTRDNIALSLAKRIVKISSHNRDVRLDELMSNLIARGHPRNNILEKFGEVFSPSREPKVNEDTIVFTTTHNTAIGFPKKMIKNIFQDLQGDTMKRVFRDSRVVFGSRQPKSLRKSFVRSKFSFNKPKRKMAPGLFNCRGVASTIGMGISNPA